LPALENGGGNGVVPRNNLGNNINSDTANPKQLAMLVKWMPVKVAT
jgi:hypothetical protein